MGINNIMRNFFSSSAPDIFSINSKLCLRSRVTRATFLSSGGHRHAIRVTGGPYNLLNKTTALIDTDQEFSKVTKMIPSIAPTITSAPLSTAWPQGTLLEMGGPAANSIANYLLRLAQHRGAVATIQHVGAPLFPPDVANAGVDLGLHRWVRVESLQDALKAAELLLRSGGFELLVVDLNAWANTVKVAALARLRALARSHGARLLFLRDTPASTPSLGAPIAARLRTHLRRYREQYLVEFEVLRDKCQLGTIEPMLFDVPDGASLADRSAHRLNRTKESRHAIAS